MYWPPIGATNKYESIEVKCTEERDLGGIVRRQLKVSNGEVTKTLLNIFYVKNPFFSK